MRYHETTLKAAQEALWNALRDLESTRSFAHDDPELSRLKQEIRNVLNVDTLGLSAGPEFATAE
jgi:hypothetical protein